MHKRMLLQFAIIALAAVPSVGWSETALTDAQVPEGKRTRLGLYLTAAGAYDRWKAAPQHVKILDVRTPEEYMFVGHAEMAWNVPFALQTYEWNTDMSRLSMKRNPDFVAEVEALIAPGDTLLVMCRSGGRSAAAVDALAEAGFKNVYSIVDGMEGDTVKDPDSPHHGKRMKNGWKNAGLPWTYTLDAERMRLPKQPQLGKQ